MFRKNAADVALRNKERQVLISLLKKSPDDLAPALMKVIEPWNSWKFEGDDQLATEIKTSLKDDCVSLLLPKVQRAFISSLIHPASIRLLRDPNYSPAFVDLLFSPQHVPWQQPLRDALMNTVNKAHSEPLEYDKTTDLLRLLVETGENRLPFARKSAVDILKDKEFASALWKGATSRPIQFRMLRTFLAARKTFIGMGVDVSDLPLTPELAAVDGSGELKEETE
jgi:hypothetical protein